MSNPKILFLSNVPSPYRVDFFNELGKYCDLTVVFEKKTSDERDESWKKYSFTNFKGVFLKGKSVSVDSAFCPGIIKFVKDKSYKEIICTNFTTPTGMLAVQYMKTHKIPYYLECDGGFPKNGKGFKERIKKHFISGAKGYFSTGKYCDDYYLAYGAERSKLIRYPFTSVKNSDVLGNCYSIEKKILLRQELNMVEDKIIVTVGQFVPRKGFDILLKASCTLPENVGIYFIGGTPTQEYMDIVQNKTNIHFVGFKKTDELKKIYLAADFFVLPTREDIWGLVINEAMSYGLPVITSDKCGAGQELIKNGENGFIVPVDNISELEDRLNELLSDSNKCKAFGDKSLDIVKNYTIENMVLVHRNKMIS